MIRFLLDGTLITETDLDPNTTLLDYLRRRQGRTGAKEGCASGDCGACTVVVVQAVAGTLRYRSVNACITLVCSLHGKQLLTVEDLRQKGALHQVQQAMVDCHASQCGFCTPGIVMSLFALQKSVTQADERHIQQALSGNLCRCTGYRVIHDAARQACVPIDDRFQQAQRLTLSRLEEMSQSEEQGGISAAGKRFFMPGSVAELSEMRLRYPDARILAGGTDLILALTLHQKPLERLIDISGIPELKQLEAKPDRLEIGAGVTLSECEPFFGLHLPGFAPMLERFASRQIRNRATLAGNVANASPIGDGSPMLLSLNARLVVRRGQEVRELPLDHFFLGYRQTALQPGEFIERIIVPKVTSSQLYRAYKVSKRREDDISAVFGAFCCDVREGIIHSVRLAYGGMAPTPLRAAGAEAAMNNRPWQRQTVEDACAALAHDFDPISDLRAGSGYRLRVAQNLLRRFYLSSTLSDQQLEVEYYG